MAAAGVEVRLNTTATQGYCVAQSGRGCMRDGRAVMRRWGSARIGPTAIQFQAIPRTMSTTLARRCGPRSRTLARREDSDTRRDGGLSAVWAAAVAAGERRRGGRSRHATQFAAEDVSPNLGDAFSFSAGSRRANVRITAQEIIDRIEGDRVEESAGVWDGRCAPSRGLTRL